MATRPKTPTRLGTSSLRVIDAVLAVILTIVALFGVASQSHHGLSPLAVLSCLAAGGSVAWRRQTPVMATLLVVTALAAYTLLQDAHSNAQMFQAMALNFYMLGRKANSGRGRAVVGVCLLYALGVLTAGALRAGGQSSADIAEAWIIFVGLPVAAGHTLTRRKALTRELAETAESLEREQELSAALAAEEERNRMARELHDAIAHNLSVMVIQTSAARRKLVHDRPTAQSALHVVQQSGRDALEELRRIVGVVHRDDDLAGAAPGLSQLDGLIARSRSAGLDVEIRSEGSSVPLSPGLDLVAYRVVQEALTNAIKHAGPATVLVRVTFGTSSLELEITDSGRGGALSGRDLGGSGYGLVGMHERVALFGGQLSAGPGTEGGFVVQARLPLAAAAS